MALKKGDRIFYQKNGEFFIDKVADILTTDEGSLYELVDDNWWCVTDDEILDESDYRVQNYMSMKKDKMVKLSDVREWLQYNARKYYESDSWSSFEDEDMIRDLCKSLLYH